MGAGHLLAHGRQESLRIEESGDPKHFGFALNTRRVLESCNGFNRLTWTTDLVAPAVELRVALQELGEPEAQRGRLPRYRLPHLGHPGVEHGVHGLAQIRRHDDGPFDGQFQIHQDVSDLQKTVLTLLMD